MLQLSVHLMRHEKELTSCEHPKELGKVAPCKVFNGLGLFYFPFTTSPSQNNTSFLMNFWILFHEDNQSLYPHFLQSHCFCSSWTHFETAQLQTLILLHPCQTHLCTGSHIVQLNKSKQSSNQIKILLDPLELLQFEVSISSDIYYYKTLVIINFIREDHKQFR